MKFPSITGSNLLREKFTIPDHLEGEYNLLFVPFQQWHQRIVDTWIPFAEYLENQSPTFRYYELPTIRDLNILAKTFINEGMRAGIPDRKSRERTITLYTDKEEFRKALDINNEDTISVFLLDRKGNIIWRSYGEYSEQKRTSLLDYVQELNSQ